MLRDFLAYAEAPPADSSGGFSLAPSNAKAMTEEGKGELSEQTPITHDLALSEMLRQLNRRIFPLLADRWETDAR